MHAIVNQGRYKLLDQNETGRPQLVPKPRYIFYLILDRFRKEYLALLVAHIFIFVFNDSFLERLEAFLRRELKTLHALSIDASGGLDPDTVQERRLQAHREAFDYLIAEFRTYRGLLVTIKNEYETTIERLREKILELQPLKVRSSCPVKCICCPAD